MFPREDCEDDDQDAGFFVEKVGHLKSAATWFKAVEKGFEALLWRVFRDSPDSEKHVMFVADGAAAKMKGEKVVVVDAPEGTSLLFAGPITTEPTLNSLHVASIGGVDFYMNPPPQPPAGDILVAAWQAKPTGKKDNVTVKHMQSSIKVYVTSEGEVRTDRPDIEDSWKSQFNRLQSAATDLQEQATGQIARLTKRLEQLQQHIADKSDKSALGNQQLVLSSSTLAAASGQTVASDDAAGESQKGRSLDSKDNDKGNGNLENDGPSQPKNAGSLEKTSPDTALDALDDNAKKSKESEESLSQHPKGNDNVHGDLSSAAPVTNSHAPMDLCVDLSEEKPLKQLPEDLTLLPAIVLGSRFVEVEVKVHMFFECNYSYLALLVLVLPFLFPNAHLGTGGS